MLFQKHSEDCCRQRWSNSVERFRHRVLNLISVLHLIHQTEYGICSGLFHFSLWFCWLIMPQNSLIHVLFSATDQTDQWVCTAARQCDSVCWISCGGMRWTRLWLHRKYLLVLSFFHRICWQEEYRYLVSSSKWVMLYVVFAPMSLSHLTF